MEITWKGEMERGAGGGLGEGDEGAELGGEVFPTVDLLAGANEDTQAGDGRAEFRYVEGGDVAIAANGGR